MQDWWEIEVPEAERDASRATVQKAAGDAQAWINKAIDALEFRGYEQWEEVQEQLGELRIMEEHVSQLGEEEGPL